MHGMCMVHAWYMNGTSESTGMYICMVYARHMHGMCMVYERHLREHEGGGGGGDAHHVGDVLTCITQRVA